MSACGCVTGHSKILEARVCIASDINYTPTQNDEAKKKCRDGDLLG